MKRLAQRIAGAIARVEDAASQMSTASEPAAAAHWEEQRQQAAAEVEELVEERALLVEMIMEAPGERSSPSARSTGSVQAVTELSAPTSSACVDSVWTQPGSW